jgi:hypothetical protein
MTVRVAFHDRHYCSVVLINPPIRSAIEDAAILKFRLNEVVLVQLGI